MHESAQLFSLSGPFLVSRWFEDCTFSHTNFWDAKKDVQLQLSEKKKELTNTHVIDRQTTEDNVHYVCCIHEHV